MKYNFHENQYGRFNNMRSYLFEDEAGLLMASWPKGRLEVPFPYFNESMSGFEYCAAAGMIYEGMEEDGLKRFISGTRDYKVKLSLSAVNKVFTSMRWRVLSFIA